MAVTEEAEIRRLALREAAKIVINASHGIEWEYPIKARQQIARRLLMAAETPKENSCPVCGGFSGDCLGRIQNCPLKKDGE